MAMNLVPYMRSLQKLDVTFTVTFRLEQARRDGGQLVAVVGSDYGGVKKERRVDQIVINHGTVPNDQLYFDLKLRSTNKGELDHRRLLAGLPQSAAAPAGDDSARAARGFQLFRLGDAVSARNTHAAIYDALRLMKDI
jgi:NADPH-dependent 2,4-dienoyl-CoA reductase/sulfur reductase-like enzyme